nr:NAD(P)-dependent alcohol dehydrogenase [Endozoicomonas sp.]
MINAYAANEPGAALQAFQYDPGPLKDDEVEINVTHCGLCHSDLSMWKNDWGITEYPFVPGHEVAGHISTVGKNVTWLASGDRVGLGWHSRYCLHCHCCLSGDHNLCPDSQGTIVGRHGGFADKVRAQATSVVKLPDSIRNEDAGPLFCGGITVFNPMVQFGLAPTSKVAVIGIGGLGHMAVKFLNAWGCEVTAFTSSESKRTEALAFGAHKTLNSRDSDELKAASNQFD